MFVVVEFDQGGRPIKATEADIAGKALKIIEDPLAFNQIDVYKIEAPGSYELVWWKPYGTGIPKIINKIRRRHPGKENLQ